jgi:glycine oxidase
VAAGDGARGKLEGMASDAGSTHTADVIVIGGGLIGSSIAFRLAQARLKVLVLDRGEPGAEASAAAAGMLAPQGETTEPDEFFAFCAESHALYPDFVKDIEGSTGRDVGYRREGTLLVAADAEESSALEKVYQAQTRYGLIIERLRPEAVHQRVAGLSADIRFGLELPRDHWIDNQQLTQAVIEAAKSLGASFLAGARVVKLNARNSRVESLEACTAPTGAVSRFSAGTFVLAAGCWSGELAASLGMSLPVKPCRGQMIEFEAPRELPCVVRSGHHYLVPRSSKRIVVGTTAEYAGFEKAVTGAGLLSVLHGAMRFAPFLADCKFRRAWAGLRPDTADHLPVLGFGEFENLAFATGHFRNGILLAPITAQLIAELITTDSTSRSIEAYRLSRFLP